MTDAATVYSYVLIVTVYGVLAVGTVGAARAGAPALGALTTQPGARAAFYRNSIANLVILTGITVLIVALHPGLTAAGVGWAWPAGKGLGPLLAGCSLALMAVLHVRARRGALPAATVALLPRTTGERWLAAGAAVAFGVGEELIYRGLLPAIGTGLLGLPVPVAAVAGLAVFVAAHAHQGRRGMLTVAVLGSLCTALYLASASLLLPILVHTCWDAMVLLLTRPTPASPMPASPIPAAAEGAGRPLPEEDRRIRLRAAAPTGPAR